MRAGCLRPAPGGGGDGRRRTGANGWRRTRPAGGGVPFRGRGRWRRDQARRPRRGPPRSARGSTRGKVARRAEPGGGDRPFPRGTRPKSRTARPASVGLPGVAAARDDALRGGEAPSHRLGDMVQVLGHGPRADGGLLPEEFLVRAGGEGARLLEGGQEIAVLHAVLKAAGTLGGIQSGRSATAARAAGGGRHAPRLEEGPEVLPDGAARSGPATGRASRVVLRALRRRQVAVLGEDLLVGLPAERLLRAGRT